MYKKFFEERNLLIAVDDMAKRYGKLPHEVLGIALEDFSFNLAVMITARFEEQNKVKGITDFSKFGITREVRR